MADSTLNSVNEHCLDNIMKLAETTKVIASEAIFDTHGTKLWAAGARITPELKERLMRHKLRKPLETSLSVEDCVTQATILAAAERLIEEVPALQVIMANQQAAILKVVAEITLQPVVALLMTVADKSREGALRHGVLVALIAVSLGLHRKRSGSDPALLALTGLIHDIGLLYVQPDFLLSDCSLKSNEWKHVAAHPLIGQIVIGELTDYPRQVMETVATHHERFDGSGYPCQLTGTQISPSAQILAMAEILSGIVTRQEDVLARACLAIKCVPGEHPHDLISVFSTLKHNYSGDPLPVGVTTTEHMPKTHQVVQTLALASAECKSIAKHAPLSPALKDLLQHVELRLAGLRHALKAAGIEECLADGHLTSITQNDYEIFLEIEVIGREIGWRERDIARDLYLRLGSHPPVAFAIFTKLIEILDNPANS